jgi:uncharacterized protein involved in type VI secretion and phage assembly
MPITYVAEPTLKIDGQAAPQELLNNLQQIVVEESLHLPSTFTLVIHNPYQPGSEDQEFFKCGDSNYKDLLAIGKQIEIGFSRSTTESKEFEDDESGTVFMGEITAFETYFSADSQAPIVVRGYDVVHRLHRGRYNRSFQNMTDKDIVNKIAGEVGLSKGTIDSTSGPYGYSDINNNKGYVFQYNQTNMDFMRMLACRNGFECFVQDNKLHFRKPKSEETLELSWLQTLSSFSVRVSSAEQVKEVEVRSWDYQNKKVISQVSNRASLLTSNDYGKGADSSQAFGGKPPKPSLLVVDQPIAESNQAKAIADSLFNELSGEFVQADAQADGNPKIRPGRVVKLQDLGPYSGEYYITETRHLFQNRLYTTDFSVRGLRGGDLFSLLNAQTNTRTMANLMVGIVTDNNDPSGWGRVRVKLPALTEEHASYWARVVGIGAGSGRGFDCLPEINDEVLVGFEAGDIHRPYIIGGVWNGKDKPPEAVGDSVADGKVRLRTIKTRLGHTLQFVEEDKGGSKQGVYLDTVKGHHFYCNDSDEVIETKTAGSHQIKLDDKNKKILVQTSGGQKLEMSDSGGKKITLSTSGSIEISATQGITLKCGANKIDITTSGITIQSSGTLSVKGMTTSVEGTATTAVKSTGVLNVQGTLVKIN